jgi:Sigma-70, region 4
MLESPEDKKSWSLRFVRQAIRDHVISFPSQVPVFRHLQRADIQWRIVLLYFVHGWSSVKIASRYGMTRERVAQLLRQWTSRAILRGYLDRIPQEPELLT